MRKRFGCGSGWQVQISGVVCAVLALHAQAVAVELLVGITSTNSVMRYDGNTGTALPAYDPGVAAGVFIGPTVPGGNGNLSIPFGLLLGTDGNVYVGSWGNNSIKMYDGTTGHYIKDFVTAGSGTLLEPDGMAWGPDGNLYVASYGNSKILRYQGPNGASPGAFINEFVPAGSGGLSSPQGIMFGPPDSTDGNLYVASALSYKIFKYDKTTGAFVCVVADGGTTFAFTNMIYEQVYHDETQLQSALADYHRPACEYNKLWTGNLLASITSGALQIYGGGGCPTTPYNGFGGCTFSSPKGLAWGPYRPASGDSEKRGSLYVGNYNVNNIKYVGPNEQDCNTLVGSLMKPTYILFKCGRNKATLIRHVFGNNGLQGETDHTVTLQGDNMSALMPANGGKVTIQKMRNQGDNLSNDGTATKDGHNYRMGGESGNDLLVDFDLTDLEAGRYGIIPTDPCGFAMWFPDAVLVYLPELTNGSFEEGWTADREGSGIDCAHPESWNTGNRTRPKHWDPKHYGWQGQFDIHRDGSIWQPCTSCTPPGTCTVKGVTGLHYGSIQNNFTDADLNGMFQTIAAPFVPVGSQTSTKAYSIYIDARVASFNQSSFGRMVLYDGDDLCGTVITENVVNNTQGIDPDAIVSSPDFVVTVPAGYTYTSNPPILTIEFLSQSMPGDECDPPNCGSPIALKGFHLDNVRSGCMRSPWADADGDGDVDMDDFGAFQLCYTGSAFTGSLTQECQCFDHDPGGTVDGVIDSIDFTMFMNCANGSGPGILVTDPNCL